MAFPIPTVGVTHDVVIYDGSGNIAPVGLIVKPFSYRVSDAPTFVPRMATGAPSGTDYEQTVSWVQDAFLGSHGEQVAGPTSTDGYYKAVGMAPSVEDGRMYTTRAPLPVKISNFTNVSFADLQQWGAYLTPKAVHLVQTNTSVSARPYAIYGTDTRYLHGRCIFQPYVAGGDGTAPDSLYTAQPYVKVVKDTTLLGDYIAADAVCFSGCAFIARMKYTLQNGERTYLGVGNIVQHWNDALIQPVGSTYARCLAVYDHKLWRSWMNEFSYYDVQWDTLGDSTAGYNWGMERAWSTYYAIDAEKQIIGMESYIGRLFIATPQALYAYEAGRSYKVADFSWNARWNNFSIFKEVHGSLWFNIGEALFRYTSGGLLEEMNTNFFEGGIPTSLTGGPRCIYVVVVDDPFAAMRTGQYKVYRLDIDTGACQEILDGNTVAYSPSVLSNGSFTTDYSPWTLERTEGEFQDTAGLFDGAPAGLHHATGGYEGRAGGSVYLQSSPYDASAPVEGSPAISVVGIKSEELSVTPGEEYYAEAYAQHNVVDARVIHSAVTMRVHWYDASHTMLSFSPSDDMTLLDCVPWEWVKGTLRVTAPATAAYARLFLCTQVYLRRTKTYESTATSTSWDIVRFEGVESVEDVYPVIDVAVPTAMEHAAPVYLGPVSATFFGDQGDAYKGAGFLNFGSRVLLDGDEPIEQVGEPAKDETRSWGYIETPWIDYGRPKLGKNLRRFRVYGRVSDAQRLWATYKTPREEWVVLGTHTGQVASAQIFEFTFGDTQILTNKVKFRVGIQMSSVHRQPPPYIESMELDSMWAPIYGERARKRVQFNAIVVDNLELINHTVENSAAWVIQSINSLAGSGLVHTVALPYPPPTGHTTKALIALSPGGAGVPILAHSTPSGAPGADVGVVITEA